MPETPSSPYVLAMGCGRYVVLRSATIPRLDQTPAHTCNWSDNRACWTRSISGCDEATPNDHSEGVPRGT